MSHEKIVLTAAYAVTDAPCSVNVGGAPMDLSLSLETVLSYTFNMG